MISRRGFLRAGAAVVGAVRSDLLGVAHGQQSDVIIDMHVHLIRGLRGAPVTPKVLHDNPLVSHWTWHEHNGDLFVQEMNVAGVQRALLKTFNSVDIAYPLEREFGAKPEDFDSGEDYMLTYRDKYPDRFIWAPVVNPTIEDFRTKWLDKFRRGLRAIVLFPGLQDHRLDHEHVTWVLDECQKRGIKGIMMSFENVDRANTSADYIKQLYEMIERFSGLHFDFMHTGYQVPHMLEREPALKLMKHCNEKYGNVWAQTCNYYLDTKYPFPNQLAGTKDLFDNIGPDKVIWASDWPWIENIGKYPQFLQSVRENCTYMNSEQMAKYLGRNALEFLALS